MSISRPPPIRVLAHPAPQQIQGEGLTLAWPFCVDCPLLVQVQEDAEPTSLRIGWLADAHGVRLRPDPSRKEHHLLTLAALATDDLGWLSRLQRESVVVFSGLFAHHPGAHYLSIAEALAETKCWIRRYARASQLRSIQGPIARAVVRFRWSPVDVSLWVAEGLELAGDFSSLVLYPGAIMPGRPPKYHYRLDYNCPDHSYSWSESRSSLWPPILLQRSEIFGVQREFFHSQVGCKECASHSANPSLIVLLSDEGEEAYRLPIPGDVVCLKQPTITFFGSSSRCENCANKDRWIYSAAKRQASCAVTYQSCRQCESARLTWSHHFLSEGGDFRPVEEAYLKLVYECAYPPCTESWEAQGNYQRLDYCSICPACKLRNQPARAYRVDGREQLHPWVLFRL